MARENRCDNCNKLINGDEYVIIDHSRTCFCFSCYHRDITQKHIRYCRECGKRVLVHLDVIGDVICLDCKKNMISCNRCGHIIENKEYVERDSEKICYSCVHNGGLIRDYSYNPPNPTFYGANSRIGTLFMGIELEVYNDCDYLYTKDIDSKYWYLKYDGSISHGCEIVSYPITFEYLKKNKNIILDIAKLGKGGEIYSNADENCGLHIHLSKAAFGNYHLWKFMRFIYSSHNRTFIYRISGRNENSMNRWAKVTGSNYIKARAKNFSQLDMDRHAAVNLLRRETVELRIFVGTLDPVILWGRIEFTHALYEYTRVANSGDLTHGKFKVYLDSRSKMYPNALKLIREVACA